MPGPDGSAPPAAVPGGRQKVYLETYGCTTNLGDTRTMAGILAAEGHHIVNDPDAADVLVMNTCTVVDTTEARIRHRLGEWTASGKRVIAAGCLAAAQPDQIRAAAPDAALLTPRTTHDIGALVSGHAPSGTYRAKTRMPRLLGARDAVIQLSEGCLFSCAYCSTKHARGDQTSYPLDDLVGDARDAVNAGATEIRLTCQDTSGYGWDTGADLPTLLSRITDIGGDFRVRVGMMHPRTAHRTLDALLDALDHDKVFKFLHLPIQSGSPRILKAMKRGHSLDEFWHVVDAFRQRFAGGTVSTDLIIGYPGETEADHRLTLELVEKLQAEHVNVTRFSARPGTEAKHLPDRVPTHVVKARSRQATATCLHLMAARYARHVGAEMALVVTEAGKKPGSVLARGPGYEPVAIAVGREAVPLGSRLTGRIIAARETYLIAEAISEPVVMSKRVPTRGLPVLPVLS